MPVPGSGSRSSATGTPLRQRLYLLSAAAIVPLAVMAGLGLEALRSSQADQAEAVGLELSRSVANAVDAELRSVVAALEALAASTTLDQRDVEGFRAQAVRILAQRAAWTAIVLSEPDGAPLVDTRVQTGGNLTPLVDKASFDRAVATMAPATGHLTGSAERGWFVPVRVPVVRERGVRFVLSALVSPSAIRSVLDRQRLPSDWVISIVDANGLRVARSRAHEENLGGRLSETAQRVVDQGGTEGFGLAHTLEGERIFTPFTRLPNGWIAVLGLPTTPVDAATTSALSTYGSGVLLSIALAVLGALWIAWTITQPMAELRDAAEALGQGRRPVPPATSLQEVRDVAAALAVAADDLARGEAEREELLRKEREARQTAEAADRAKDEFMAVLSHELRTPLNAVLGWARMLQGGQLQDDATIERAMDAIARNAGAQAQLIDDLLDLSRIASGKLRLNLAPVDLPEILRSAVDAVRPAAVAKSIRIETSLDDEVTSINGDPARIQQIAWNLLMNAVKFTPRSGTVRLRLERSSSQVRILVSDTGQGISPEILPHVFERFRQSDSSSTRHHGGLGLGLALVKHLVELHGGTVRAESPGPDEGATFTVALPVALADATAVAQSEASTQPGIERPLDLTALDGLRTLVVDDDLEGLALAEAILTRAGAEVRLCRSADQGFEELRRWRPDAIISDIEMPGEDGYSLIRKVRALPAGAGGATPAIALTAYGRTEDRARSLEAGFDRHMPKPVDPGDLTRAIQRLVASDGPHS